MNGKRIIDLVFTTLLAALAVGACGSFVAGMWIERPLGEPDIAAKVAFTCLFCMLAVVIIWLIVGS